MNRNWQKLSNSGAAALVIGLLVGGLIGHLAWGEGRGAQLAILFPFVVGIATSRVEAIAIAVGYSLMSSRGMPDYANSWFDGGLVVGYALYVGMGLLAGLGWSLGWSASDKPWRKALASVLAYVVMLVLPMASLATGHPLLGWAFLFSGWGWFGLFLSITAPALFLWLVAKKRLQRNRVTIALAFSAAFLAADAATYKDKEERYLADFVAVSTAWGVAPTFIDLEERTNRMGKVVRGLGEHKDAAAVVFPESILQTDTPDLNPFFKREVLQPASDAGMIVVLGADVQEPNGCFQNTAIAFYPDRKTITIAARQPVPLARWNPWTTYCSFPSYWSHQSVVTLAHGMKTRIVFGYEEFIPLLALLDEARHEFQITVVMSNTSAVKDGAAPVIQRRHSQAMARLFSRNLIRAENSYSGAR